MSPRSLDIVEGCPVFVASKILGKRWTIMILQSLMRDSAISGLRFNELHKDLNWISPKVLTERLREMESEGIVQRNVDASTMPTKVCYRLTTKGQDLRGVLTEMQQWGSKYGDETSNCTHIGFKKCDVCQSRIP
jgi:DNA-binding HxlR family transcriptional regulator